MSTKKIPITNPATGETISFVEVPNDYFRDSIPLHEYIAGIAKGGQQAIMRVVDKKAKKGGVK